MEAYMVPEKSSRSIHREAVGLEGVFNIKIQ
jgi:hypothetical protein